MSYSLSAFDRCVTRAHARALAKEKQLKRHENMVEWFQKSWDSISHVLAAFLAVVVLATALSFVEGMLTPHSSVVEGSLGTQLGRVHELIIPTAHAASAEYSGLIVSTEPSTNVTLSPGQAQEIRVQVQNTGTEAWHQTKGAYISLYTKDPNYHTSPYRGPAWRSDHQTGQLVETSVLPGETGTFAFFVYGPPNFEGQLSERFQLAAEDRAWIAGGELVVNMTVVSESLKAAAPSSEIDASDAALDATGYEGLILIRSAKTVTARANEVIDYRVGVKNTGSKAWSSYELHDARTALATTAEDISFYHSSWSSTKIALANTDASVAPGTLEFMDFSFRAPHRSGEHTMRFQLVADGLTVPGAVLEVPVEVTSNAAKVIDDPLTEEAEALRLVEVIEEPRIRVGIDQPENSPVIFTATTDVNVIESDVGYHRLTIPAGQQMSVAYNGAQYVFESHGEILLADSYLRFEGAGDAETIFTVSSFSDVRSYNTSLNDNRFRDTLELRYNTTKDRTWLINELPMQYYLYGVDEATDGAPGEYHKSLMTAARTYALYMWEHKTKYKGEHIDVRSTTYDQVYHGYGAEIRHPNILHAIDETRGVTIEHEGETIVASYFARSDGRTRNWSDVWGRSVPYAVSVEVPCEAGNVKWGHGVGLSQIGAACMAEDEGKTYQEILHHFYTGVDLVKRWK